VEAQVAGIRGSSPAPPLATSRRTEEFVLPVATRTSGVQQAALRQAVEPVFRRPAVGPVAGEARAARAEGTAGEARAAKADDKQAKADQARAARAPAFEWIHLEILPPGKKPDPRGYAVYSGKRHPPEPVPVILIDTAA
jgi:hypothetical protein